VRLVVVGSIGLDTVQTPSARREEVLGGSVSYACAAASFFAKVGMVGVVGDDFPEAHRALYRRFGIDLRGLQSAPGRTFRWSGVYEEDMNRRRTLATELNVFESFEPALPPAYRKCPFLLLGNISPELQLHVLGQLEAPEFVAADTMDLWIRTARAQLDAVISRVNLLMVNECEMRELAGESNVIRAARAVLRAGPQYVVVKKGEHGALLVSAAGVAVIPAFPVADVQDPTGAGDAFAGGVMGALARGGTPTLDAIRGAIACGTVVASFAVESFGLDRLAEIGSAEIEERLAQFRSMVMV